MIRRAVRTNGRAGIEQRGFSLIELLIALAVFATMAALAYGGLDSVARTRAELGRQQDAFRDLMRGVGLIERDLRQAISRPVRGN
jgi:general secretion pathway protein J